jgi:hypothetical protein
MSVGIDTLKELLGNVSSTAVVAIKAVKKIPAIKAEIADLKPEEIVSLVVQGATIELPKIIAAFRE